MPIVFALAVAGIAGLWLGGYPMQQLSSALVSGSQSWVLLAIPAFVFAGNLMERCGMSHALVELARALVGWVKGGLGMSVIVVAYFFSDICGSKMAEVSALGSSLMPPLTRAGYDRPRFSLADRVGHRDGHAGAARDLHDRAGAGHQHLSRRAVRRRLHSGAA
jgi:C4-dicarboxylate transporter DctM subunit